MAQFGFDRWAGHTRLGAEQLEGRDVPAVTAAFVTGVLTVTGDGAANVIAVSTRPVDVFTNEVTVTADGQPVAIVGGAPNPADFTTFQRVVVNAGGGDDAVTVDQAVLQLSGQTLALSGGAGNDALTYGGFAVASFAGGSGNDTLTTGRGPDAVTGGSGNDLIVVPSSPGADTIDGGAGSDTVRVVGLDRFRGSPANDGFELTADGTKLRVTVPQGSDGRVAIGIAGAETLDLRPGLGDDSVVLGDLTGVAALRAVVVDGGDGNDTVDASAQANAGITLVASGGAGDDALTGGAGLNVLLGGDGVDRLTAGGGFSVFVGGAGNDTFDRAGRTGVWIIDLEPGDVVVN